VLIGIALGFTILDATVLVGEAVFSVVLSDVLIFQALVSPAGQVVSLPPGVRLPLFHFVEITITRPSAGQSLLALVSANDGLGWALLNGAGLWVIWDLVRSVGRRDPFGPVSVRRLRTLGFLAVLGYPLLQALSAVLQGRLFATLPALSGRLEPFYAAIFSPAPLMVGLCFFALAEVFAHGMRLREDVEATV
jgi:hypothetical protein